VTFVPRSSVGNVVARRSTAAGAELRLARILAGTLLMEDVA